MKTSSKTTRDYLLELREVIIQERECAKRLDIKGLETAVLEKEQLLTILNNVVEIADADKSIAAQVSEENRRNAYLFHSTLGWIRDTMQFFGKRTVTSTYSSQGNEIASTINGRLLSGRV
ncbi:MAG: flagellar protein FlgN [Deltaproteobacteria bacterium]|nr:MAG: flagellar protein FlgN [Deltaproteobacteria bacterium]